MPTESARGSAWYKTEVGAPGSSEETAISGLTGCGRGLATWHSWGLWRVAGSASRAEVGRNEGTAGLALPLPVDEVRVLGYGC